MSTARQKVLEYLRKTHTATVRGMARALNMSAANVRHHLSILASDGRVESDSTRRRGGKGRPEKVYSLSQAAQGDNLPGLVDALLTQAGVSQDLEAVGGRILDPNLFVALPVAKRLVLLVEKLNEKNYQARWEAGAEGPRVIFRRCPYARVIDGHPELCKMDQSLIENALGRPVIAGAKNDVGGGRGLCPFIFRVV